jgi:hypothetical protein
LKPETAQINEPLTIEVPSGTVTLKNEPAVTAVSVMKLTDSVAF